MRIGFAAFTSALMATAWWAPSAAADYASTCNSLIATLKACTTASIPGACSTLDKQIADQCKCHEKIRGEWKMVTAAVGKDGVCGRDIPTIKLPEPPPPPQPIVRVDPDNGEAPDRAGAAGAVKPH